MEKKLHCILSYWFRSSQHLFPCLYPYYLRKWGEGEWGTHSRGALIWYNGPGGGHLFGGGGLLECGLLFVETCLKLEGCNYHVNNLQRGNHDVNTSK